MVIRLVCCCFQTFCQNSVILIQKPTEMVSTKCSFYRLYDRPTERFVVSCLNPSGSQVQFSAICFVASYLSILPVRSTRGNTDSQCIAHSSAYYVYVGSSVDDCDGYLVYGIVIIANIRISSFSPSLCKFSKDIVEI